MRPRAMVLTFLLYLTIDLSNPFVLGAFRFDPDEAAGGGAGPRDAGRRDDHRRSRATAPPSDARMPAAVAASAQARREARPAARVIADWVIEARRIQYPPGPPSPFGEDH